LTPKVRVPVFTVFIVFKPAFEFLSAETLASKYCASSLWGKLI
jgi:hypothetical protein